MLTGDWTELCANRHYSCLVPGFGPLGLKGISSERLEPMVAHREIAARPCWRQPGGLVAEPVKCLALLARPISGD